MRGCSNGRRLQMMAMQPDHPHPPATTLAGKLLCLILVSAALGWYWSVLLRFAHNMGQGDDFVDVLWFFEIFLSREHWLDQLAALALPNHEHVTVFNHLLYLAAYALTGEVNFIHHILLGHAVLLLSALLLADWLRARIGWWYALAMAVLLYVNLFYWHASLWAITALSNQAVILFALLAARAHDRQPQAIVAPLCWSVCAAATQFNGLLVLPALVVASVIAAWQQSLPQHGRQLLAWCAAFAGLVAVYFSYESPFAADHLWRYVNYTEPHLLPEYLAHSAQEGGEFAWQRVVLVLPTLLAVAGATVFGEAQLWPAMLLGGAVLALLAQQLLSARMDRFWLVALAFATASVLLIAIGRGIGFGAEAGLLSRYRLYGFLLLVLAVGGVLQSCTGRRVLAAVLLGGVLVQAMSWQVMDDIAQEKQRVRQSHYYWLIDGGLARSQMPFYPHNQDWRLFHAFQRGYYSAYEAIDTRHKPQSVQPVPASECAAVASEAPVAERVSAWSKKARALAVELQVDIAAQPETVVLLFCGEAGAFRVFLGREQVDEQAGRYYPVLVLKNQLPPSQYHVYWWRVGHSAQLLGNVAFP